MGSILIGIAIFAAIYLCVYWILKLVATILVFFKIPWAGVIAGCAVIIIFLRQYSFMNYIVVALGVALLVRLLVQQGGVAFQKYSYKLGVDKKEYHQALRAAYASIYTFLVFGALYANFNYIVTVGIGGLSFEEYKELGIFAGSMLSVFGIGPAKWIVLAPAVISLVWAYTKASDFDIECGLEDKEKVKPKPQTSVGNYYSDVLGISVALAENTVEASRSALLAYFKQQLAENEAEKITEAALNAAAFEITDMQELLEMLQDESGLTAQQVKACVPALAKETAT